MKCNQTAERVSPKNLYDNFVFQRSLLAYYEAAGYVSGSVLEIGTGSGYGVDVLAQFADKFVTLDKCECASLDERYEHVSFLKMNVPPLSHIANESFDFVVTFQLIEHIEDDKLFLEELYRVLKKNGKLIISTPNRLMSLTRNPWHVREYSAEELDHLLLHYFPSVEKFGVFGNHRVSEYYHENRLAVQKITKWDVLKLQYRLPRQLLQLPYDLLNRLCRKRLFNSNKSLVSEISMDDYYLDKVNDYCFDLFYIAQKT